jgi:hypothetical protein
VPDTERKPLLGQTPRGTSGGSGCAGAFFIAFGLPFMAAGAFLGFAATGGIPLNTANGSPPPPDWVIWSLVALFGGAGAFLTLRLGVGSLIDRSRLRARRALHPNEPWRADHAWDPAGASYSPGSSLAGQFAAMAFMAALLAPFNYFVFYEPQPDVPTWARFLVGFFDLILVLVVVGIVMTLVQQAKYGRARLAFRSFPFFLGDTLSARLGSSRPIGQFKKMTFTLRCIEERTETTRSAGKTTIRTVCDHLWSDEIALDGGAVREGNEVPVSFTLPSGDYATRLAEPPARYWELAVVADTPGLDFSAKFLVPVYASGREIPGQVLRRPG